MQVIEVSLCRLLFFEEEQMRNENMIRKRQTLLTESDIHAWASSMLGKLRYHPDAAATLTDIEVRRRLFNAYAGALYLDHGLSAVEQWLCLLVTPESGEPPFKRMRGS